MDPKKTMECRPEPPLLKKRILKKIGVNVHSRLVIFNRTDATAYIILSDTPVHSVNGIAIEGVSLTREMVGTYKDQRSFLLAKSSREFELFAPTVYYSIYFKLADGTERVHTIDKLHNAFKNDINLLQRHVAESQPRSLPLPPLHPAGK